MPVLLGRNELGCVLSPLLLLPIIVLTPNATAYQKNQKEKTGDDDNKRGVEWLAVENLTQNEERNSKPVSPRPEFYFSTLTLANSMDRCGDRGSWCKRSRSDVNAQILNEPSGNINVAAILNVVRLYCSTADGSDTVTLAVAIVHWKRGEVAA